MEWYFWVLGRLNKLARTFLLLGLVACANLFYAPVSRAQEAIVSLEPEEIVIGQHATLRIRIELPTQASLVFPAFTDTITQHIEIVSYGRPDTLLVEDIPLVLEQLHTITSWEEGFHPIPPIDFLAITDGDTLAFKSEALLLKVQTVEVDTESEIKDIKNIFGISLTFADVLPYIIGLLILFALGWFLIRYIKKRKAKEQKPDIWKKPDIPAHMAAFSSLSHLKNKKLWQKGEYKTYHSELANIMRLYIEKRFDVGAMELTTHETLLMVEPYVNDEIQLNNLRQILEVADLVKFAKFIPESNLNESSMELAFEFVDGTKLIAGDDE